MNRRIRGKINSGEVGALYDNGRKNKTTAKCKWVYTRNACRKNKCVPFGDCKMESGKLKLFGLKNRNLQNYKERIHIMEGRLIAFVIWVIIGVLFIVMGIYDFNSKKAKPFGFWANAEVAPIEDVKGYNRALGILWCVYGFLFTLIGLPLLDGQNSGLIIIPILGAMLISIAAMVAYVVGIEPKYRKKK